MGTHASFLVVDEGRTTAAYGYEHGDGQQMMEELVEFCQRRNSENAWEFGVGEEELWPVTPAEFVTRWHAERLAEHLRCGRTGSGLEFTLDVPVDRSLHTEYAHLVVVNGLQVVSARRIRNASYGHGASYTVTFDPSPVTRTLADSQRPGPSLHQSQSA